MPRPTTTTRTSAAEPQSSPTHKADQQSKPKKVRKLSDKRAEQVRLAQASFRMRKKAKLAELEKKLQTLSQAEGGSSLLSPKSDNPKFNNFIDPSEDAHSTTPTDEPSLEAYEADRLRKEALAARLADKIDFTNVDAVTAAVKANPELQYALLKYTAGDIRRVVQTRIAQRNHWVRRESHMKQLEKQIEKFERRRERLSDSPQDSEYLDPSLSESTSVSSSLTRSSRRNFEQEQFVQVHNEQQAAFNVPRALPKLPSFAQFINTVNQLTAADLNPIIPFENPNLDPDYAYPYASVSDTIYSYAEPSYPAPHPHWNPSTTYHF